jgi:hypothetical protein
MPLSNKNRRKRKKQLKRDERGAYMRRSCRYYMPHLGSISSLFLFHLTIIAPQIITNNDRQEKVIESLICQKGKARECLDAKHHFTYSIFYMNSNDTAINA